MAESKDVQEKKVLPERVTNEMIFEAPVTFLALPKRFVGRVPATALTHSVRNVEHLITQNTGAITVTNFTDGQEGQDLYILGDGFTTLQHGTKIFLSGAADLLLDADKVYHLKRLNNKWYEVT